jgi:hypothetical protein
MVLPSLDANCGRNFTFRMLVECGETQERTKLPNVPFEDKSYKALEVLADNILDPVVSEFKTINITYCFAGKELSRAVPARNAPQLDQHSAYERNSKGNLICKRGGAAADFIVPNSNMYDVAMWVIENCDFDRLYFYGSDRPIHVSCGPEKSRKIIELKLSNKTGNHYPKVYTPEQFSVLGT